MAIISFCLTFHFQTVEKFGGLDILVSNAAVNPTVGGVLDVSIVLQCV